MDIPTPEKIYTVTVDGEPHDIKMTYGLLTEILKVIPSPDQITDLVVTDPGLREYVIRRMMTGNKRVRSEDDLVDTFDINIDVFELDGLVAWVAEHVLHFFMKSAAKTASVTEKYEATIQSLTRSLPSQAGSQI